MNLPVIGCVELTFCPGRICMLMEAAHGRARALCCC